MSYIPSTVLAYELVATVAASTAAFTVPPVGIATVHDVTLTAACALTFPTLAAGAQFTLLLRQDGTGSRTVTWPASVRWPSGTAPVLSTAAGSVDILAFLCAASAWYGFTAGKAFT